MGNELGEKNNMQKMHNDQKSAKVSESTVKRLVMSRIFIEAGYDYLNHISHLPSCNNRSCVRCRVVDLLTEIETLEKT